MLHKGLEAKHIDELGTPSTPRHPNAWGKKKPKVFEGAHVTRTVHRIFEAKIAFGKKNGISMSLQRKRKSDGSQDNSAMQTSAEKNHWQGSNTHWSTGVMRSHVSVDPEVSTGWRIVNRGESADLQFDLGTLQLPLFIGTK